MPVTAPIERHRQGNAVRAQLVEGLAGVSFRVAAFVAIVVGKSIR